MAKSDHYFTKFESDRFYHVYNRTVDRKPMFTQERNYIYFLNKMDLFLSPVLDIYAWCLMNNHFHLMIKIKPFSELETLPKAKSQILKGPLKDDDVSNLISESFKRLFQSYALSFNNQEGRVGSLFQNPFKRALVDNDFYFTNLVYYIHANPEIHGFVDDFRTYPWSSYWRILQPKLTKLKKQEVIQWFGDEKEYLNFHSELRQLERLDIFMED